MCVCVCVNIITEEEFMNLRVSKEIAEELVVGGVEMIQNKVLKMMVKKMISLYTSVSLSKILPQTLGFFYIDISCIYHRK